MSTLPAPSAQFKIKTQAPKDTIQFRDNQNHVLAWIDATGAAHYVGDGTGVSPTHDAVKIFGFATVGSAPGPVLAPLNSVGQVVGYLDQMVYHKDPCPAGLEYLGVSSIPLALLKGMALWESDHSNERANSRRGSDLSPSIKQRLIGFVISKRKSPS